MERKNTSCFRSVLGAGHVSYRELCEIDETHTQNVAEGDINTGNEF